MSAHARLSASSSDRWLNCTRAPQYEEQFPESSGSTFAQEGQFAHAVAEQDIAAHLGLAPQVLPADLLHFDNPELREHVSTYVNFAIDMINVARREDANAIVLLERKVDFSNWVPEGFGTCDLVIVTKGVVTVVDLKFGRGLRVDAQNNSQLRLYGIGAAEMFNHLYDITQVAMYIVQPRLGHISKEVLSKTDIYDWANTVVTPAAQKAWRGEGEFVAGDHCRWCRGKAVCAARAKQNLDVARFDFAAPDTLDDAAIADILEKAARLHSWVKDVQDHALAQALQGHKFTGYKLVQSRSVRKYSNAAQVAATLIESGIAPSVVYAPLELNNMTALETAIGKKKFTQILGDLIVKSPGKPTLVAAEDKRPEFSPAASAAADFFNL